MVEIVVAMAIFALMATFMAQTLGSGLRGVLLGKRREVATQEANRMLEVVRSLSYNAVGMVQPLEPDPAIDGATYGGEPLVFVPDVPNHPLNPHIQDLERGSTTLTRYIYVTWAEGNFDLKRVSVRVTWVDAGTQGPENEVRIQTLVNASGLVPTGAGGQPMTAKTYASGGSLTVHSSLLGLGVNPLNVSLPTSTGASTYRAVQNTSCTTRSTSIQALGLDVAPGYSVTATADDDPRTAIPSSSSDSKSGVIWENPENPLPAPVGGLVGGLVDSPVACDANAQSLATQTGTASAVSLLNLNDTVVGLNLLGIPLFSWLFNLATLQTMPVTQDITHELVDGARQVPASASTHFQSIRLLDLPILNHGVVRLDAISATASVRATDKAEGGGAEVDAPAFTLRVLDTGSSLGSGCQNVVVPGVTASRSGQYCVISVNPAAAGFPGLSIPIGGSLAHSLGLLQPFVNLSYGINLSVLPPTASPVEGELGPNGERRWAAEYSPISITAGLSATLLGATIIEAAVALDLGTVRAEACAGATCS